MEEIKVNILRPSGNDTAIVEGIPALLETKKKINDLIMGKYPNVEQVGFYNVEEVKFEMAGGEFCGNGTRAFVYYLNKKTGRKSFEIIVPGVNNSLSGGIKDNGKIFIQIPIKASFESIQKLEEKLISVDMEGIRILLDFDIEDYCLSEIELKNKTKGLLKKYNYDKSYPASGVMYLQKVYSGIYKLRPVVLVRDVGTLIYETACGSGTVAFAMYLSSLTKSKTFNIDVLQPSGEKISALIRKNYDKFEYAEISGNVKELLQERIILPG